MNSIPFFVPSGRQRGARKQVKPAFRLCEHEKRIAHRRRDEELVAGDLVLPIPDRRRPRRVGAHVRAALFLRHRHPDRRAVLLRDRDVAGIVDAAVDLRQPLRREFRLQAQRRRRSEGHGDGAAMSRLDLGLHIEPRRPSHMRALARLAPRRGVQAMFDRDPHQLVIGGMKPHEIDPPAIAVVRVEVRRIAVGERAQLEIIRGAELRAERFEVGARPIGALARNPLAKRSVAGEEVVVGEREGLIQDFVGGGGGRHGRVSG